MQTVALVAQTILQVQDSTGRTTGQKKHEGDIFMKCSKILSPMTGEAVGLGEVPDPVFSQKIVGDGMAVIPCIWTAHGRGTGAFDPCGSGDGTFKWGMLSGFCKAR